MRLCPRNGHLVPPTPPMKRPKGNYFSGCFGSRFMATPLEIARWVILQKICFFCFLILQAVWRSRNLECVYIFSTKAVLRPLCRRYRGGFSTKKIDNQKILDSYFSVFRYLKPFGAHATSNVYI